MVSKEQAVRELARRDAARAELARREAAANDPTKDMGTGERLLAGVGSGLVDVGRKTTNLLLPDSLTPDWANDEAISRQEEIDSQLLATGAGATGNLAGSILATAPVGGAAGAGLKALSAGSKLARAAPVLARALGAAPTRAALEGSVQGLMMAKPGERLSSALSMAGLGAGLSGVGGLIGKGIRGLRIPKSEEAAVLEKMMARYAEEAGDEFIPISQAAKPGLGKQFYEGIVSNIPGGGQVLRKQFERSLDTFRETAMARALPHGTTIEHIMRKGDDIQEGFAKMATAWKEAFGHVNKMDVRVGVKFSVPKFVAESIELKIPKPVNGVLKGQALVDIKEAVQNAISRTPKRIEGKALRDKLIAYRNRLEMNLIKELRLGERAGKFDKGSARARVFDSANWNNYRKLRATAERAGGASLFTPAKLATKATRLSGRSGIQGKGGRMQVLGKAGQKVLTSFPSRQGIFQTAAALGLMGGIGAYSSPNNRVLGAAAGLGIPIVGSRVLAAKAIQKLLMGEIGPKTSALIRALRRSGRPLRATAIAAAMKEDENAS